MTIKYTIPYGDSSFETFNKENAAFVDKTVFIEVIDHLDTKYPVLLKTSTTKYLKAPIL